MKTFSNMGTKDLALTIQGYEYLVLKLVRKRFCLVRDGDYSSKFDELTKEIHRVEELRSEAQKHFNSDILAQAGQ